MKKSKVLVGALLILLVLLLVGIFVYAHYNNQYPRFESDEDTAVAIYPLEDGNLAIAPGVRMKLDTGSLISTITQEDLQKLAKIGMQVDSVSFPSIATDLRGKVYVANVQYKVTLPVYQMKLVSDSLGNRYRSTNRLINVITEAFFLPAAPGDDSRIGSDIVERFVLEYQAHNNAIALRTKVPEGYRYFCDLKAPFSIITFIGTGNRYYMAAEVQNEPNDFFIDTGLADIDIKLPSSDRSKVNANLTESMIRTSRGTFPALKAENVWVKMGNHIGTHSALYGDDGGKDYTLNPFAYFEHNMVFDFPHRKVYQHPLDGQE